MPAQVINEATRLKRLTRCKQLIRRLTVNKTKKVFFTDEKLFYVSPPVNCQNDRVWSAGRKRSVSPKRLLVQRARFSARCRLGCLTEEREVFTSSQRRLKLMPTTTLTICCLN